ncbi:hypothetical protein ACFQ0P_16025 [Microbacterium insulae]|uniref:Uncharacterized protein n=1 Tax=Microbacterium insulae TaxID=483014 RepID=A0ABW3AMX3_9MICO
MTPADVGPLRFCRSRNLGRRCTRPLDHAGLHRHRTIMWTDASADPPRCVGSGAAASPAPRSADGYPHGRALCTECLRFIPLEEGRIAEHDTSDPEEGSDEAARRREWFNTAG